MSKKDDAVLAIYLVFTVLTGIGSVKINIRIGHLIQTYNPLRTSINRNSKYI